VGTYGWEKAIVPVLIPAVAIDVQHCLEYAIPLGHNVASTRSRCSGAFLSHEARLGECSRPACGQLRKQDSRRSTAYSRSSDAMRLLAMQIRRGKPHGRNVTPTCRNQRKPFVKPNFPRGSG
jgi:hypothetical protein